MQKEEIARTYMNILSDEIKSSVAVRVNNDIS